MNLDFGVNQALVEDQYRRFLDNPMSVDEEWRVFFAGLAEGERDVLQLPTSALTGGRQGDRSALPTPPRQHSSYGELAWNLGRFISRVRSRGHYYAHIDPLGINQEEDVELLPEAFGITAADLNARVPVEAVSERYSKQTVGEIIEHMKSTWCGTVGFEVMHIEDGDELGWLINRIDSLDEVKISADERRHYLQCLTQAEGIERFLHMQYVGAKRFSLEGLETVIPMLDELLEAAGGSGVSQAVLGMAHRGRLNVLCNTLGKDFSELFTEFDDRDSTDFIGRGDVKYHLGQIAQHQCRDGNTVDVAMCFNPSHLEFVDPVVVGRVRARVDKMNGSADGARSVLPIMIHGDSAFMGQGVVFETLNLAELEGYRTGGTVHIVLNNQVGFTTSPSDARSSRYASDVVRFMRCPVFHVNADDVEQAIRVTRLALEYRQKFGRDVCIDLVGYRKYGHNEGDEPRFTQPVMYSVIDEHPSVRELYARKLTEDGVIDEEAADTMISEHRARMQKAHSDAQEKSNKLHVVADPVWDGYVGGLESGVGDVGTGVPEPALRELLETITTIPEGIGGHSKVLRVINMRRSALEEEGTVDWGTAESLAFASLVAEGHFVRVSGQDARRGTFAHRHAYLTDPKTDRRWSPLCQAERDGGHFEAWDSPLSEAAVLGFEYGYSLEAPSALVIWEAQFGDFANGAQVIIDQFICAGEDKWESLTGLVMLLPHGFEGMGPEHSYARLGRFLQLCAEDNMQVCDCTTPAQIFHLLRRQVKRPWRKPLVVMTPKSLLRAKQCRSELSELTTGTFQRVIADTSGTPTDGVTRVLLCSGRVYYDLEAERQTLGRDDVHIVRLEQLYPLDGNALAEVLRPYLSQTELVWVQDEPWNMGAWYFIKVRLQAIFGDDLPIQCVARAESASPATGSGYAHRLERKALMDAAFAHK